MTAGDLILALRICAAPGFPFPAPADVRPRWPDILLRWWLDRRPEWLKIAAQTFRAYQDAHCSFPTFYRQESTGEEDGIEPPDAPGGQILSAPWALARVAALVNRTTLTWAEAWRLPLALPAWCIGTLDEMEGAPVRFLDESEDTEETLPPDVEQMSEKEIARMAARHLPPAAAAAWLAARKDAKPKRVRKPRQKKKP